MPVGTLFEVVLNGVVVDVFISPEDFSEEPFSDFVVDWVRAGDLGLSELTLTWRRLVPKLLTEGEPDCRLTLGWGIFSPNLLSDDEDEIGLVNARVVIGDCVICCAAAAALTRFAAVLLM